MTNDDFDYQEIEFDEPEAMPPVASSPIEDPPQTLMPTTLPSGLPDVTPVPMSSVPMIDQIAAMENAIEIQRTRFKCLANLRQTALMFTDPPDWIVQPDGTALARKSASEKIGYAFGVRVMNMRPTDEHGNFSPRVTEGVGGSKIYKGWADAFAVHTHQAAQGISGALSDAADFTGRHVDDKGKPVGKRTGKAFSEDVIASVDSLIRKKATLAVCGIGKVTVSELEQAWEGTGKSTKQATSGHGGGSSNARRASADAEEGVAEAAKALGKSILATVGGDQETYVAVVREITKWKGKDGKEGSFDSLARLGRTFQVENAAKAWASHPLNDGGSK